MLKKEKVIQKKQGSSEVGEEEAAVEVQREGAAREVGERQQEVKGKEQQGDVGRRRGSEKSFGKEEQQGAQEMKSSNSFRGSRVGEAERGAAAGAWEKQRGRGMSSSSRAQAEERTCAGH